MAESGNNNADGAAVEPGDKSVKILRYIVIALGVVILCMAGTIVYVIKSKPAATANEEVVEPPKVAIYETFDKELVVNLPPNGDAKLLQVGIAVLTYDPLVSELLKKHMPLLRNNINIMLASQDTAALKTSEGKQALQAQLLEEVNKVLQQQSTDASVEQVFFTSFVLQ